MTPQIKLVGAMGSDLSVVNAARSSYLKRSEALNIKDVNLIDFLTANKEEEGKKRELRHTSPVRHGLLQFLIRDTERNRMYLEGITGNLGSVYFPSLSDVALDSSGRIDEGYVETKWTASLQAVLEFVETARYDAYIQQRMPSYEETITSYLDKYFPITTTSWFGNDSKNLFNSLAVNGIYDNPYTVKYDEYSIPVLDKGYVRFIDKLPSNMIRDSAITFEISAPFFVRSQWFKYVRRGDHSPLSLYDYEGTGNGDDCSWNDPLYARNEASRRYITLEPEFYVPTKWRTKPANSKQGSGEDASDYISKIATRDLNEIIRIGTKYYDNSLENNLAPEQARGMLPYAFMYTTWRWTGTIEAVRFFLMQRLAGDAQSEIREYAKAVLKICRKEFSEFGWRF